MCCSSPTGLTGNASATLNRFVAELGHLTRALVAGEVLQSDAGLAAELETLELASASIDETSPDVEHIEVHGSHVGLGVNAQVYRIVAQRLDQPRPR